MDDIYSRLKRDKRISSRIPVILAIIILIFSSTVWYFDYTDSRDKITQDTSVTAQHGADEIQRRIVDHIELISSIMMTEWVSTDNISELSDFNRFLEIVPGFFDYYQSYLAINYINTTDIISWVYPFEPNQGALNRLITVLADGSQNEAYLQARETKEIRVTPVISLFQGVTGLATYLPIIYQNQLHGMFNVVFEIDALVDDLIESIQNENYSFHILEDNIKFYVHGSDFAYTDSFVSESKIEFFNSKWVLYARPNSDLRFQGSMYDNIEILIFGILAALVSFAFSRFIVNQNKLLEENFKKKEELEKIMFQYQKMDDLGILAGGIAHDFNNLLMGLQANFTILTDIQLELLLNSTSFDKSVIQEMKGSSISIHELLERATNLTSQILSFSRQSVIDLEFIDMKVIIDSTLRMLSQSIDKRIVITKSYENKPMFVYGNASKMNQLIMNVVLNSIEAMPEGGTIDINLMSSEMDTSHIKLGDLDSSIEFNREQMIVLKIRDSGEGISKENLEKLFIPFFTTKTKSKKGTGLGLAVAYRSVISMKGDIIISSKPNQGTIVNIFLPIITVDYLESKNIKFHQISNEELREIDIKPKHNVKFSEQEKIESDDQIQDITPNIMVVDDESAIRRGLRIFLRERNHVISEFENGIDAIKFYQENSKFDLVILDVNLPGMNGIQVLENIRKINSDQKVLFITGYSEDSITVDPNYNTYILLKPFTKEELLDKIDEIFTS